MTIASRAILRWPVAIVVSATAAALIYRRRRRALEAYGVDIRQARRWRSLGHSPEEAQDHQGLGPEFVSSWLAAGFTVEEMELAAEEYTGHRCYRVSGTNMGPTGTGTF